MLRKLIEDLRAITDPGERAAMATEALEHVKAVNAEVAVIRQEAAKELRDQGLTYKEIGERIGPEGRPLHFSRVSQILKGEPTGRWARAARKEGEQEGQAGDDAESS
ncbi:hypothetical protein [Nonomuraea sp. 10N515B]|uniref:hypothetical protein n=1 Tax=Nonomuraea sp. 10N515B TaxID=3457422 RepID=UPI003FCC2A84